MVRSELTQRDQLVRTSAVRPEFGRGLVAARAFREQEKILDMSALYFDDYEKLRAFHLSHEAFADRTVEIQNVRTEGGEVKTVYAVLVGPGQYVQHYNGIRKAPNAELVFRHEHGFNNAKADAPASLTLSAHGRNGAGIASGSEIVIDYSSHFEFMTADDLGPDGKRFKGSLGAIFARQEEERNETSPSRKREKDEAEIETEPAKKAKAANEANNKEAAEKRRKEGQAQA